MNSHQIGTNASAPLVSNGLVYVLTQRGKTSTLEALSLANGTLQWSWEWKGPSLWKNPPVLANGMVYLSESTLTTTHLDSPSAYQGFVVALRASDGHPLWKTALAGSLSPMTIAENVLYLSNGKALLAFSAEDGHQLWQYQPDDGDLNSYNPMTLMLGEEPAILVQRQVYLEIRRVEGGYSVYDLVALNPQTGRLTWRYWSHGFLTTPVLAKNTVYVNVQLNQNVSVVALNTSTGAVVWTYHTSFLGLEHLVVDKGVLYLEETPSSGTSDVVVALQATNGQVLKRYPPPESFEGLSTFIVSQQTLYLTVALRGFGTQGAEAVIALKLATGAEVWNTSPFHPPSAGLSVIVSQNQVYVVTTQTSPEPSTLFVFQAASGKQLWSYGTSDLLYSVIPAV